MSETRREIAAEAQGTHKRPSPARSALYGVTRSERFKLGAVKAADGRFVLPLRPGLQAEYNAAVHVVKLFLNFRNFLFVHLCLPPSFYHTAPQKAIKQQLKEPQPLVEASAEQFFGNEAERFDAVRGKQAALVLGGAAHALAPERRHLAKKEKSEPLAVQLSLLVEEREEELPH